MSLFTDLRAAALPDWETYMHHGFVEQLGAGTLSLPAFQDFLVQDYLFLLQFARANALAAFKARSLAELRSASSALDLVLSETALHVGLTEQWGIERGALEAAPEKLATIAYTRYVLDCGQRGDLLELNVALAPCTIGYAEIGERLAPQLVQQPDHPYRAWISEYASDGFQRGAQAAVEQLDTLAQGSLSTQRFGELTTVFRTATRLETDFWQQAFEERAL